MSRSGTRSVLVTGASGHLGRRVVEMLLEARAGHVIATTRHPERIHDLARQGVQVRRADLDEDVATISRAFVGAERMLLVSTDALDRQGHRLEQHQRAIAAAVSAGVRHVVYTSIVHPEPGSPVLIAPDHYGTEVALESAGLGYTVLRNNLYADLLLMSLPRAVASGRLEAAAGTGGAAYVTREDCARVAAAALASDFTGKRTLDVTGPEVVTYALLASLATELSGRPVSYVGLEPEAMRTRLVEGGMPAPVAELMVSFDLGLARGLFGPASRTVTELTGHPPTSILELLENHRAELVAV